MKRCPYCGGDYPDEVEVCAADGTPLEAVGAPETADSFPPNKESEFTISSEEQRFWNQMTFRDFAALFLRIQSLWLFFYALQDVTYLSRYINLSNSTSSYSGLSPSAKLELLLLLLRIIMNIAVGLAIIKYAERVLSWLVKDWISNQPPKR